MRSDTLREESRGNHGERCDLTARAHRANRGRQIRLCSWLAAGSVLGRSKTVWQRMSGDKSARISHIDKQAGTECRRRAGDYSMLDLQHHFRRRVSPHLTWNPPPRPRDNPGGHPDQVCLQAMQFSVLTEMAPQLVSRVSPGLQA